MTTDSEPLASKRCIPCRGEVPPMGVEQAEGLLRQLSEEWQVVANHHLERVFRVHDFKAALDFANRIGDIADQEGHHPDLHVSYGRLGVQVWTHKIDGLTLSDFILAAKIDKADEAKDWGVV